MTKYYVENWKTEEVIEVFDTYEQRQEWIKKNVTIIPYGGSHGGYLKDGTQVGIYEIEGGDLTGSC